MRAWDSTWHDAVDLVPQIVLLIDGDSKILRANRTVEQWRLGPADALVGLTLHAALHPSCSAPACYLRGFERDAAQALRTGEGGRRYAWDRVLERRVLLRARRSPAGAGGSKASCAIVTIDDLTSHDEDLAVFEEAAQAADAARELTLADHAYVALEHACEVVALYDADGAIRYVNPTARALLGSLQQPAGSRCRPQLAPPMALEAAAGMGKWSGAISLQGKDGRRFSLLVDVVACRGGDGAISGYSVVARAAGAERAACGREPSAASDCLVEQRVMVQEAERRRIAADLHDGLGQSLALLKRTVHEVTGALGAGQLEAAAESAARLRVKADAVLDELRRVSMNLRPSTLDDLGLVPTLSWFLREFEQAWPAIRVERDVDVREADIPEPVKIAVFRILQEATHNTVKYAQATRLSVRFAHVDGCLELAIADDGVGFDPAVLARRKAARGLGMSTMKERAEFCGGRCEIIAAPGKGVTVVVHWPAAGPRRRYTGALQRRSIRVIPLRRHTPRRGDEAAGDASAVSSD